MKCVNCGGRLALTKERHYKYVESGLPHVTLGNINVYKCEQCAQVEAEIPNIEALHTQMAEDIAHRERRLCHHEIRFLRKHIGLTGAQFAQFAGVTPETVSRWENGRIRMGDAAERLLRLMALCLPKDQGSYSFLRRITDEALEEHCEPEATVSYNLGAHDWQTATA